ncbi:hypothetical protein HNP86_002007 [Methanococcus maripaludis]|uniref:Uncharacterized protein n=1 Tax=Methanococcus maripaludis TaxID=39152 RepID=A0A7J9NVX9_METMI|nr:hypothetical protein [Methanococcus maripaludis]MBA2851848.1 hypothetical protein [Methanococcus maripaludis]
MNADDVIVSYNDSTNRINTKQWVKRVTSINQSCKSGYSLQGEFINKLEPLKPGIHVMKYTYGKQHSNEGYVLFTINHNGEYSVVKVLDKPNPKVWAVELWVPIISYLTKSTPTRSDAIIQIRQLMYDHNIRLSDLLNPDGTP